VDTIFFIISKVAWGLIRPETWGLLLVAAIFLALLSGRLVLARWMSGLTLVYFVAFGMLPAGPLLLGTLESRYPANPPLGDVAGIIVLGGGESGRHSDLWQQPQVNEAGDRFIAALALAHRFPEAPVLFTGGLGSLNQDGLPGAEVANEIFLDAGLAPERLILEPASRTTAENASASLALRPDEREGEWLLVTSGFHMPRAIETFCAAGWTDLTAWPTDFRSDPAPGGITWGFLDRLSKLDLAMKEYVGLLAYRLTGRASRDARVSCLAAGP